MSPAEEENAKAATAARVFVPRYVRVIPMTRGPRSLLRAPTGRQVLAGYTRRKVHCQRLGASSESQVPTRALALLRSSETREVLGRRVNTVEKASAAANATVAPLCTPTFPGHQLSHGTRLLPLSNPNPSRQRSPREQHTRPQLWMNVVVCRLGCFSIDTYAFPKKLDHTGS